MRPSSGRQSGAAGRNPQGRSGVPPMPERRRRTHAPDMSSTMWAVRKVHAAPGLDLVEVPVPEIGEDEALVRVEAASICGTDLHIRNWDDWAQQPDPAAARPRARVRRNRRRDRARGSERGGRRLRFRRESRHLRRLRPLPYGTGAHVRADADPRRRPRRCVCGVRRHPRQRSLAERPDEAAAGDRDAAGAVRQRSLRRQPRRPGGQDGRNPRLRPRRPLQHRDRARRRRCARHRLRHAPVPSRPRASDGRARGRGRLPRARLAAGLPRPERGRAPRHRVRDVRRGRGDHGRLPDRPQRRAGDPVRHPVASGRAGRRRRPDLQEPRRLGRQRSPDLGELVPHALAARARRRRPASARHRAVRPRRLRARLRAAGERRRLQDRAEPADRDRGGGGA